MMNKRLLQSILIAGVVIVWGMVIYRLVHKPGADELTLPSELSRPFSSHTELNYRDSSLYLSYSDPFLHSHSAPAPPKVRKTNSTAPTQKTTKQPEPVKPATTWPEVVYKGVITNKSRGQQLLAMVVINGREQIVRNGEIISGFEVVGITTDQISLKSPEKEVKGFGR